MYCQLVDFINGDMVTKVQAVRNTNPLPIQDMSMHCLPCLPVHDHDAASDVTTFTPSHRSFNLLSIYIISLLTHSINGEIFNKVQATRNTTILPVQEMRQCIAFLVFLIVGMMVHPR